MVRQDESFGVVPLSKTMGHWEVFLIKHKHGRYWGFPKGHAEHGETPQQAAVRELKEETNLDIIRFLAKEPLKEQYSFMHDRNRIDKSVYYFIAEAAGEVALQQQEISDGLWLPLPEAMQKLTHPEGRSILAQVEGILPIL